MILSQEENEILPNKEKQEVFHSVEVVEQTQ